MSNIEKPPKCLKTAQTITPEGGEVFTEAAGGDFSGLVVKKHSALADPSPFPASLKELQGLQDEEAAMLDGRVQSPRRRKLVPMIPLRAGSYGDLAAEAVNEAVKPVVSNALIVSSINCFIAFIGLFIETYNPDEQASAGTSSGGADAASGGTGSDGTAKAAGKLRSEEIYAGLMSSLRAFLHVAFIVMVFQVLMGRVHIKRVYKYVVFFWCTVLCVCYLVMKTAAKDDFDTWFSAEITIHAADSIFFGFTCYVLSVTRAEANQERD